MNIASDLFEFLTGPYGVLLGLAISLMGVPASAYLGWWFSLRFPERYRRETDRRINSIISAYALHDQGRVVIVVLESIKSILIFAIGIASLSIMLLIITRDKEFDGSAVFLFFMIVTFLQFLLMKRTLHLEKFIDTNTYPRIEAKNVISDLRTNKSGAFSAEEINERVALIEQILELNTPSDRTLKYQAMMIK